MVYYVFIPFLTFHLYIGSFGKNIFFILIIEGLLFPLNGQNILNLSYRCNLWKCILLYLKCMRISIILKNFLFMFWLFNIRLTCIFCFSFIRMFYYYMCDFRYLTLLWCFITVWLQTSLWNLLVLGPEIFWWNSRREAFLPHTREAAKT